MKPHSDLSKYWRLMIIIMLVCLVGCGGDATSNDDENDWNIGTNNTSENQNQNQNQHQNQNTTSGPQDIAVSPEALSLAIDESVTLNAVVTDDTGGAVEGAEIDWESDNDSVATVDSSGVVTGVAEGGTTVIASVGELSAQAEVVVSHKNWRHVETGAGVTCGVTWQGELYCWGSDFHGASGQQGQVAAQNSEPVLVPIGSSIVGVAVGHVHYCAWDENGQTYCWGFNQLGQVGTTPSESILVPTSIGGQTFSKVDASGQYSCGVTDDGEIYCWGSNFSGELGQSNGADLSPTPVQVPLDGEMIDVSTAPAHACAVEAEGSIYCWGRNFAAAVDPTVVTDQILGPTEVDIGEPAVAVNTGVTSSCALTQSGELHCWGYNASGEMGRDTSLDAVLSPGAVEADAPFVEASSMGHTVCGVTDTEDALCWGENRFGALGDGGFDNRSVPAEVPGGQQWSTVSAGNSHACGIDTTGDLWCWGSNAFGQAGDGRSMLRMELEPVANDELRLEGLVTNNFNMCGFERGTDDVYCWGRNEHFQLQTDRPGHNSVPEPLPQWAPEQLALGDGFACGIEFGDSSAAPVRCWGQGEEGRLGTGIGEQTALEPTDVDSDEDFVQVAAGNTHACATSDDGEIYCWGSNQAGQTGAPAGDAETRPHLVDSDQAFLSVAAGLDHSCGLTDDGEIYCWGSNEAAQLGFGTDSATEQVGQVDYEYEFTEVAVGNQFSCAITADSDLVCWGQGVYFTGVPGSLYDDEPLVLDGDWEKLEVGPAVVCAVSDEQLYCAGWDQDGWIDGQPASAVQEMAHVDFGVAVDDVAVGSSYVCVADTDGVTSCLGHDAWGVLGDGAPIHHLEPVRTENP